LGENHWARADQALVTPLLLPAADCSAPCAHRSAHRRAWRTFVSLLALIFLVLLRSFFPARAIFCH
jgi:hypothetical protein